MGLSNDLKDKAPAWAFGCEACSYGIVAVPDIVPALPLHESRAVQAAEDMVLFCDCRAGFLYRQQLRRVYNALPMSSRQNIRALVLDAMPVPSVHLEPTP